MNIKTFKVISSLQKRELYNFIKSIDLSYNKTCIEMTKVYEGDTVNEGNSVFILFHKGKIRGSVALITKEISIKGEAFITDVYIEKDNMCDVNSYLNRTTKVSNTEMFLKLLIEKTIEECIKDSAESIKIGIHDSEKYLIPYIRKLEFNHIYDAVIMRYRKEKNMESKVANNMELSPLCIFNSHEYMNIHNKAFENSPNGGTIDDLEVKDYIVQYANNEDLIGICCFEKRPCGIYELSIDGNTGWVDTIGIMPIYQKKGLGKTLLVKCINKLYEKKMNEIKLLVITSNEIAVNMYKDNGFEDERVFSSWFEKKI